MENKFNEEDVKVAIDHHIQKQNSEDEAPEIRGALDEAAPQNQTVQPPPPKQSTTL